MPHDEDYEFDPSYYRLFWWEDEKLITVVEMQHHDEYGADPERYLTDADGERYVFKTKDEAIEFLNKNIKKRYIDPEYRIVPEIKEDDKRNFRHAYKGQ